MCILVQILFRLDEGTIRKVIRRVFRIVKAPAGFCRRHNSCEMELNAAGNVNFDAGRYGIDFVVSPRHADGIVITGPVSENMSEALHICYDAVPEPKIIILAGTDAISGGIFTNGMANQENVPSGAIMREFINRHHVDLYVPGNPLHPLTFINGVMDLLGIK